MAQRIKPIYKVQVGSKENVEMLLQELYNEACKNIEDIQTQMNKLSNSVDLNEEVMDGKVKYSKAMNDFIANKGKAIQQKLDVAKLLSDIIKNESKGNNGGGFDLENFDWDNIKGGDTPTEEIKDKLTYHLK